MLEHLEESTNEVKSRKRFSKLIHVMAYLVIWAMLLILFWFGTQGSDASGFSILAFLVILPVSTIVISFFIGKDEAWGRYKWFMLIFFGVMYMLAEYATFSLANMSAFNKVNLPEFSALIPGFVCAAIGMAAGFLAGRAKKKRIAGKE